MLLELHYISISLKPQVEEKDKGRERSSQTSTGGWKRGVERHCYFWLNEQQLSGSELLPSRSRAIQFSAAWQARAE